MGTYTYFWFTFILQKLDDNALEILRYMVDITTEEPENLPNHPFFENIRWEKVLSYEGHSDLMIQGTEWSSGFEPSGIYFLHGNSWIKDYDDLIDLFFDWIHPYTKHGTAFSLWESNEADVIQRYPREEEE